MGNGRLAQRVDDGGGRNRHTAGTRRAAPRFVAVQMLACVVRRAGAGARGSDPAVASGAGEFTGWRGFPTALSASGEPA